MMMKIIITFIIILSSCKLGKAQQCDNIYGLDFSGSNYFFVSLDTITGSSTLINNLVGVVSFSAGSSTFDTNNGNYIFSDQTGLGIVVVNSTNGNIVNTYPPNPYRIF